MYKGYGNNGNSSSQQPERRQNFGRYPLIQKAVVIIKGPYKGYLGICKEMNNNIARIELHTNAKIVNVSREDIDIPGANKGRGDQESGWFDGGKTPMYGSGSKTPMWGADAGVKTPYWFVYLLLVFDTLGNLEGKHHQHGT